MEELKKRFEELNERERILVLISVALVAVFIFYWGVLSPLNSAIVKNQKSIEQQTELLQWVKSNAQRAIHLKASARKSANFKGSLPQVVNSTSGPLQIEISRMQPQGEELQVWVDSAKFSDYHPSIYQA